MANFRERESNNNAKGMKGEREGLLLSYKVIDDKC
jgi:hypothetical protein